MLIGYAPGAEVGGSKAVEGGDEQLCWFVARSRLCFGRGWGGRLPPAGGGAATPPAAGGRGAAARGGKLP